MIFNGLKMTTTPLINFNVITLNVGTPFSLTQSEYPDCNPIVLDRIRRKNAILSLMTNWLRTSPIIVLQEVPYNWKQDFDRYFTKRNYTFHCMNYGQKTNGILGVGIAVPNSYAIDPTEVEFIRVADYIECDCDCDSYDNEVHTNIENAKKRANLVVRMKIHLNNGKSFYLYNYHMPCAFKTPLVQILHIHALKRIIASFPNIPYILAGDMNILPTSKEYEFLTDTESPSSITLKSSYFIANKEEPEFTCFNYTTFGGEFRGCLDYIFVSEEFKVLKSHLLLTTTSELPNADCPSDHLPLRSVLSL
jgi:mRNA deadenylase 3'-5' endonuclease subunit Ccr4